jgi:hypothetical protein
MSRQNLLCDAFVRTAPFRRRTRLDAEALESRTLPAALSIYEVAALQTVNQLRANPATFANDMKSLYLGGGYQSPFGYSANDPIWTDLRNVINQYQGATSWRSGFTSTGPNTFLSVASGMAAKPPLVWETAMQDGAVGHNQWMYTNVMAHSVFSPGQAPSTWETPSNHIPGITRNYAVSQGDYFNYIALGLNAAGENISYGINTANTTFQAYKNGQISLNGFYQRLAYFDTVGFMLEYANGSPSSPWGHLENLTSATYNFNIVGFANYLYENPAETPQDGTSQSYFSTHRLGLRSGQSYANFLVYQDANNNNVYDAGEGVPGQVTFNFGAGSVTLPAAGYSGVQLPASGSYTVSATYLGNSLGSQPLVADGTNKTFAFKVGATQATTTTLTSTPNASTGGALVTFTATVAPSPGAQGTVTFLDNGAAMPGGSNVALVNGVATFQISTLTPGAHPVTASYSGASGFGASTSNTVNQVVATTPQVVSVVLNDNIASLKGAQRSRVASIVVVFNQPVQLDVNAFTLALHTNNVVFNGAAQPAGVGAVPTSLVPTSSDNTTWVITFSGNTDLGSDGYNSLQDGVYDFNVVSSKVHPSGVPGVNMTSYPTTTFHRLFGDTSPPETPSAGTAGVDYLAVVNTGDNLEFRGAFNSQPNYKAHFDFSGDGVINTGDNLEFRNRFNRTLTWKV